MLHKKTFTKKAPDIFSIQVQDFNILDIFYKIRNLKKWKTKAVVPFLPRNLKLHIPWKVPFLTIHYKGKSKMTYNATVQCFPLVKLMWHFTRASLINFNNCELLRHTTNWSIYLLPKKIYETWRSKGYFHIRI